MSLSANKTQVRAMVELRRVVTVTVPLPGEVTAADIHDVACAGDAVAALPPALKNALEVAALEAAALESVIVEGATVDAATIEIADASLADIHFIAID